MTPQRTVRLQRSALHAISSASHAADDGLETGGILLGHQHSNGDLTVTLAGDPGPAAIRTARAFRRDPAHAQALADRAWDTDGSIWVGDWHTHPTGPAEPSAVDLRAYLSVLSDPTVGMDRFLALIVLPSQTGPLLYPWLITPSLAVQALLHVVAPSDR